MSFYLRKSIGVGPLRFNLSKSGVGVSIGVKGFRAGAGPRGNYVHVGRGGVYYRKTLSQPSGSKPSPLARPPEAGRTSDFTHGVGPMEEIESASVADMVDSSSAELLQELDEKKRKFRMGPVFAAVALAAASGLLVSGVDPAIQAGVDICWLAATYFTFRRDALAKTVVLFYDFDGPLEFAYDALHKTALELANCAGCWHIAASGAVYDRKYHAGASAVVDRKATAIKLAAPPFLKTNIQTISIGVGKQTLFLFPDRVLVYAAGKVGAIGYDNLRVAVSQTRFVEESAPRDARIVGETWRYVNKNGGPDRRFANNRALPICLYDELHFTSTTGLNEIIQLSKCEIGNGLAEAVGNLVSLLTKAKS